MLQIRLQLLDRKLKVVNDHLHGFGRGESDHEVLAAGQHGHQHLVQLGPQLRRQLDPAPLAHEPAHSPPDYPVVALLHPQLQAQGAGQPAVKVYLVIQIEGRQPHGVVDGVLLKDCGQVSGVHGRVIVPDHGHQERAERLPVLVEQSEENSLTARPPAVLPAVAALLARELLRVLVPEAEVLARQRQVVGHQFRADLLDCLQPEELLLDAVGLQSHGVPGVLNVLGWPVFHAQEDALQEVKIKNCKSLKQKAFTLRGEAKTANEGKAC